MKYILTEQDLTDIRFELIQLKLMFNNEYINETVDKVNKIIVSKADKEQLC